LASDGLELWLRNVTGEDIPPSDIVEAECSPEMQNRLNSIDGLSATVIRMADYFVMKKKEVDQEPLSASDGQNPIWEREVCVLWVSETAFITRHWFDSYPYHSKHVKYVLDVKIDGNNDIHFFAYNLVGADVEGTDAPLEFIARLAQFHSYESIAIAFGAAPPVDRRHRIVAGTHNGRQC
jgi:hypothetical protein